MSLQPNIRPKPRLVKVGSTPHHADRRARPRTPKTNSTMFTVEVKKNGQGKVVIVGKRGRRLSTGFVNVPVSAELRKRLGERVIGSMAMGTGALLQWALDEIDRHGVSIEARPND